MSDNPQRRTVTNLIRDMLDEGYADQTEDVLAGIAQSLNSPRLQKRLRELDAEAARLAEHGERLDPDNAVFKQVLAEFENNLEESRLLMLNAGESIQADAADKANALILDLVPGVDNMQINQVWNRPDPNAVVDLLERTNGAAWRAEIGLQMGDDAISIVRNQAIRGIAEGWNPLKTAEEIQRMMDTLPLWMAEKHMRTLHNASWRQATAINQQANADLIETIIRISALDDRACIACVALHGTQLEPGEVVLDHHNGRCSSIIILKGMQMPTFTRVVDGKTVEFTTGPEWFSVLPRNRKVDIAGPGAVKAIEDNEVRIEDFVGSYDDDVYGRGLPRAKSLTDVLRS